MEDKNLTLEQEVCVLKSNGRKKQEKRGDTGISKATKHLVCRQFNGSQRQLINIALDAGKTREISFDGNLSDSTQFFTL